jgi:hypothetical protein
MMQGRERRMYARRDWRITGKKKERKKNRPKKNSPCMDREEDSAFSPALLLSPLAFLGGGEGGGERGRKSRKER